MKIRSLLTVVAVFSVLLCGAFGTAYAVLAVPDDVPGQDLVLPIICGRTDLNPNNTLNTLYAIAEVSGSAGTIHVRRDIYNQFSNSSIDVPGQFTGHDLQSFNCNADFYTPPQDITVLASYTVVVGGRSYLAGYVVFTQVSSPDGICTAGLTDVGGQVCTVGPGSTADCTALNGTGSVCAAALLNRFVGWEYLVDIPKGFASGFNALSMENGVGIANLAENGGSAPITAEDFFPRILINGDETETWNWWIVLAGRNQLDCAGVTPTLGRVLTGQVCGPDEICNSSTVHIPNELNIINVSQVPNINTIPGFPRSGFAILQVQEQFSASGTTHTIVGSVTPTNSAWACGNPAGGYSIWGWSYQRAAGTGNVNGFNGSYDVVHPFHRDYCSCGEITSGLTCIGGTAYDYITGTSCTVE